ncbi:hypothetical protein D5S19_07560 [Amycolatopsis panacis]|uniref:Uncharacterized protein n=1 Tax=Amycolatopsis panacis TaxID=2340917 RepID=A0A419I894_9PSEU|nr:hypothetical protein D5S19_07560 [Amycolatopsis panacis]
MRDQTGLPDRDGRRRAEPLTLGANTWAAGPDHAIGLQNKSTGAHVKDNKLDPPIKCEVGIDKSSRKRYQGPEPKCEP